MGKGLILNPISGGMSRNSRRRAKGLMPLWQRRKVIGGLAREAAKELGGRSMARRKKRRRRNAVPMGRAWQKAWKRKTGLKIRRGAPSPGAWKSAWKSGMRRAVQTGGGVAVLNPRRRRKRRVKSRRLKSWLSVVKKHHGDMKAAAREWKGGRTTKRRRKRRRRAANPIARRRRPGSPRWRRARARGIVRAARRRGIRRNPVRRRRRRSRRRNPVAVRGVVRNIKALLAKAALKDYAYVTGGFVAGAVVPRFVTKGLEKVGILKAPPGALVNALIGVGSAVGTGAIVGAITKSRSAAMKVTAGGMAGVVGSLILMELDKRGVLSGLGQTEAEAALRRAVDAEIRKQVGMGQFVSPEQVAEVATVAGRVGQFVSPEEVADVESVAGYGMGQDVESGAQAFDGFEGGAEF